LGIGRCGNREGHEQHNDTSRRLHGVLSLSVKKWSGGTRG
jgi:hypothetical protein